MNTNLDPQEDTRTAVSQLLGSYKAEWLNGALFELFAEPQYFKELQIKRPCVLIGGRGTGKTTVLRGLSYQGQLALTHEEDANISSWPFYGLYYRVDTNRVAAFKGPELELHQWVRCFAHYMNMIFCDALLRFVEWYGLQTSTEISLPERDVKRVQTSLHLPSCQNLSDLADNIDLAIISFEAAINNVADGIPTGLSMQSAPLDALASSLSQVNEFHGKQFYFLLDEYENFEDYQQRVVNTFIKQAKPSYTFKIGVRELGWRDKATLNSEERLRHPADYERISIAEKLKPRVFNAFATRVCNDRLEKVAKAVPHIIADVRKSLPDLSEDEEASLLGVGAANESTLRELEQVATPAEMVFARKLPPAKLYLLRYWSQSGKGSLLDNLRSFVDAPKEWEDRYNNYMYAALFTIRRGKRGIRKFYSGWSIFTQLANGNIRFLLELVHQSYLRHFEEGEDLDKPISAKFQTEAAQQVGRAGLAELEGITVEGGRLTKLLLSLGRIFEFLAETPEGHTPEATQFYLDDADSTADADEAARLLRLAVTHQALVRSAGNKRLDEADTKEFDYRVHPIYAPFFSFSHRQKRKLKLSTAQLLGLISSPRETIKSVLEKNNREAIEDLELPDQLHLFKGFYHGAL